MAKTSLKQVMDDLHKDQCTDPACDLDVAQCYCGQWTVHSPHHYTVHRQAWCGGGTRTVHCPGKTEETKLGR